MLCSTEDEEGGCLGSLSVGGGENKRASAIGANMLEGYRNGVPAASVTFAR